MHDRPPNPPDDRHPIARVADEKHGRVKRRQRRNGSMKNASRGSEVERREAGRGVKR